MLSPIMPPRGVPAEATQVFQQIRDNFEALDVPVVENRVQIEALAEGRRAIYIDAGGSVCLCWKVQGRLYQMPMHPLQHL